VRIDMAEKSRYRMVMWKDALFWFRRPCSLTRSTVPSRSA